MRILERKYSLTTTEHKYLEIGINSNFTSYAEIAIGIKRGNEILLCLQTWKGLIEYRHTIMEYYNVKNKSNTNPLYTGSLVVQFLSFNDIKCI